MRSLQMKPVTDSHPIERAVNSKNASQKKVGFTGETVRQDGDFLTTSLTVTDESAINNIDKGRQELSPGYDCELLLQSGIFNGDSYDAIQTKRTYNHLALCDSARGGADIRLHLDSATAEEIDGFETTEFNIDNEEINGNNNTNNNNILQRGRFMSITKLDGIEYNADQQVLNALDKVGNDNADLIKKTDALQAKLDSATEELKTFKERNIDEEVTNAVAARIALQNQATPHLDEETIKKIDSISDIDIKKSVIVKAFPSAKLDEKSEDYINARWDSAIELLSDKTEDAKKNDAKTKLATQRKASSDAHNDNTDNEPDQDKSRNDMIIRLKNGGKKPE